MLPDNDRSPRRKSGPMLMEPLFFLCLGVFHLHRVWAFWDRVAYTNFWRDTVEEGRPLFYVVTGLMIVICLSGITAFLRRRGLNAWWRWTYVGCGLLLLFNLVAVRRGWDPWLRLLNWMFDPRDSTRWILIWGLLCFMGLLFLLLGLRLLLTWLRHRGERFAQRMERCTAETPKAGEEIA